jgi:dipeptidyl-peptidase-4
MKARIVVLSIALALCAGAAGGLPPDRPFSLADVLSAPYPSDLVAAGRVDRLAWIMNDQGARNVWTAAAPDFRPVNLTGFARDEVFEIDGVRLTDDGATAVFVKGGRPNAAGWVTNPDSDADGREQAVWAVRTDGGRPWKVAAGSDPVLAPDGLSALLVRDGLIYRVSLLPRSDPAQVPPPELLFRAAGRNASPRFSPDGSRLAFVSERGDHSFIGVFDLALRRITWVAPSVDRDSEPRWSADGRRIAFLRRAGLTFDARPSGDFRSRGPADLAIWVADAATGQAHELWRTPRAAPFFYTFRNFDLAANDRLLFTAENEEWNHVYALPLAGGAPVDLTPGEGAVEHLGLSPDGRTLYFSTNQGDLHGRRIWKVPTPGGAAVPLSPKGSIGTLPAALPSGRGAAFLHATAVWPTSVAKVREIGGRVDIIAPRELPAEFPLDRLVTPEVVIVKSADGLDVPCQLFLPKGAKAGDRRPAVVFTHGGPIRQMLLGWHYMEFYAEAYGINQFFASRGYVVISINYRSGIGYGRSFREAPNCGMDGAAEYQDVLAGVDYLRKRSEVDPARVGAWGLSYGGLLTALSLARNSDIFKVGVDMAGVHDWSQMRWERLDEARRKVARESSPVASVENWTSPVLFIHGDDDRNVAFQQTTDIVQRLRAKGDVPIELMIVPDEPHEFLLHAHRMGAYERTFAFIDRVLGRKP